MMAGSIENGQPNSDSMYAALSGPLLPWQTRLIKLCPGSLGDRLVAEMFIADLTPFEGLGIHREARYQQYEALSYSWGYPARTAEVEVNGKVAYIPPSMADALQYLRQTAEPRWLWCDALSIDQENATEKSNQVQVMMLIFSKARRVVAWLGMPPTGMTTVPQGFQVDVEAKHQSQSAQNTVILALAQVPFFERTWIRQEIFAAHEVMFQSGAFQYPFHAFMNVAKKHDSLVVRTRIEAFQRTYSAFNISAMSASKERMSSLEVWERRKLTRDTMNSILAVLLGNKVFNCSDQRDRVYALIGMGQNTAGGHFDNLRIDYTQGVSEVYQDLTKHLINVSQSLGCLEMLRQRAPRGDLPTWAIDWRQDTDAVCIGIGETGIREEMPEEYLFWTGAANGDDWERRNARTIEAPIFSWVGAACVQDLDRLDELVLKASKLGTLGSSPRKASEIQSAYTRGTYLQGVDEQLQQLVQSGTYLVRGFQFDGAPGPFDVCAPHWAEDGDWVVVAAGGVLPFILRPTRGDKFLFIGACWFEDLPIGPYLPHRTRLHDWVTRLDWCMSYGPAKRDDSGMPHLMDIAARLKHPDTQRQFILS